MHSANMDLASCVAANMKVRSLLEKLRHFNESVAIFQELPTPDRSDRRWSTGLNGNNKSRTYRVLAPLWYWLDIFRKADVGYFIRHGGVRCHWKRLRRPTWEIYLIRSTGLMPVKWWEVGDLAWR